MEPKRSLIISGAGMGGLSAGALFTNALSGRTVIRDICRKDGKKFSRGTPAPAKA
jgi:2-polyprenyl-6-methoxyphenol hydroxylase-like FAD-dependent oxidoreductase